MLGQDTVHVQVGILFEVLMIVIEIGDEPGTSLNVWNNIV